ncbi:MAG: hypothetical protein HDT30_14380 [Clostridiales bacterium]|nr:hypothetical protein [Clostridiales bacterium]
MKAKKVIKIWKIIIIFIKKILLSTGISVLLYILFELLPWFLTLDGGWNTYVYIWGFILLEIVFLAAIWFRKCKEWCPVFAFIVIFLSLLNIFYYECISTDLEATWHFHSAHNIPFSKFEITKSYKSKVSFSLFGSGESTPRGADILYNGIKCSVYNIDGKWVDNYEELLAFSELNPKAMGQLDSIMAESKKKYQIFLHPFRRSAFECTYDIILYTKDKVLEKEKIVELDTRLSDMNKKNGEYSTWSDVSLITYHLYIVRDKKLYNKLCKVKKYQDSEDYEETDEILTALYSSDELSYIYVTDRYDYNVFQDYGNTNSKQKTTIFRYSSYPDQKIKLGVYAIEEN